MPRVGGFKYKFDLIFVVESSWVLIKLISFNKKIYVAMRTYDK